jgi:hypothetical protein
LFLLALIILILAFSVFAAVQIRAQNELVNGIAKRLNQRGVPVKYVTMIKQAPYEIEIALQSASETERMTLDDIWFRRMAEHEAKLAYRYGPRLDSYRLIIFNESGKEIFSSKRFIYPDDLSEHISLPKEPRIDNQQAKEIVAERIVLSGLSLDRLEVLSDPVKGDSEQILEIQVSAQDLEAANRSLPAFLSSYFPLAASMNREAGTYFIFSHLRLVDQQGNVLLDHVKDVEVGGESWRSVDGLYDEWYSQPNFDELAEPAPTEPYPSP